MSHSQKQARNFTLASKAQERTRNVFYGIFMIHKCKVPKKWNKISFIITLSASTRPCTHDTKRASLSLRKSFLAAPFYIHTTHRAEKGFEAKKCDCIHSHYSICLRDAESGSFGVHAACKTTAGEMSKLGADACWHTRTFVATKSPAHWPLVAKFMYQGLASANLKRHFLCRWYCIWVDQICCVFVSLSKSVFAYAERDSLYKCECCWAQTKILHARFHLSPPEKPVSSHETDWRKWSQFVSWRN